MAYVLDYGATLVEQIPSKADSMRNAAQWMEADGSPLASALAEADEYHRKALRTAVWMAGLRLLAAGDHLVGLARSVRSPDLLYSGYSMARTVAELSARAWWLLEPDLSVCERTDRIVSERLYDLRQQVALGIGNTATAAQRLDEVKEEAATNGHPASNRVPGATSLVDAALAATGAVDVGASMYRLLSAFTHGTMYGLMGLVEPLDPGQGPKMPEGVVAGHIATTASKEAMALLTAMMTYAAALSLETQLNGWDGTAWQAQARYAAEEVRRYV